MNPVTKVPADAANTLMFMSLIIENNNLAFIVIAVKIATCTEKRPTANRRPNWNRSHHYLSTN